MTHENEQCLTLSEHSKCKKIDNHFSLNMTLLTVLAEINNLLKNPDVSSAMSSSNALGAKGFPLFFLTITGKDKLNLFYLWTHYFWRNII